MLWVGEKVFAVHVLWEGRVVLLVADPLPTSSNGCGLLNVPLHRARVSARGEYHSACDLYVHRPLNLRPRATAIGLKTPTCKEMVWACERQTRTKNSPNTEMAFLCLASSRLT